MWIGNSGDSLTLAAEILVPETKVIEKTHRVCLKQADFSDLQPSETMEEQEKVPSVPSYIFIPSEEEKKVYNAPVAADLPVEDLIPLLYGNITWGASNLGSAGTRVPGSAGRNHQSSGGKIWNSFYDHGRRTCGDPPAGRVTR